jgi:hypothetical protein
MKNYIFIFVIVIFTFGCSVNSKPKLTTKGNGIIYLGIDNIIGIESIGRNVEVSLSNGELKKIDSKTYLIHINDSSFTYILFKHKNNVDSVKLICRKVPNLDIFLGLTNGTWFERNVPDTIFREFKYPTGLLTSFDEMAMFSIDSYKLVRIDKNGTRSEGYAYLAKNAEPGDIYILKDINVTLLSNGEKRRLNDIVYWIK